jgi:hypothetical protein
MMTKKNDDVPIGCLVFVAVIVLAFLPSAWIVKSFMEANSFNRITGNQISTWDAMWVELRVEAASNAK